MLQAATRALLKTSHGHGHDGIVDTIKILSRGQIDTSEVVRRANSYDSFAIISMNRHDAREGKKGIGAVHVWREGQMKLVYKGK